MDYLANYNAWLNDPRLNEEGRRELQNIAGNEKEIEYRFGGQNGVRYGRYARCYRLRYQ